MHSGLISLGVVLVCAAVQGATQLELPDNNPELWSYAIDKDFTGPLRKSCQRTAKSFLKTLKNSLFTCERSGCSPLQTPDRGENSTQGLAKECLTSEELKNIHLGKSYNITNLPSKTFLTWLDVHHILTGGQRRHGRIARHFHSQLHTDTNTLQHRAQSSPETAQSNSSKHS